MAGRSVRILCLVLSVVNFAHASPQPAKDLLAKMRSQMPADPMKYVQNILANSQNAPGGVPRILVAGDSWADVVAAGSSFNYSFLQHALNQHGCKATTNCIAIPGTETGDWAKGAMLEALKLAAKSHDYVFIVLAGNDALDRCPDCASEKKTAAQCGDELMAEAMKNMHAVVDGIHEANPAARIVGFGYDTMFGGLGCSLVTHDIFPQCWRSPTPAGQGNRCFNTQFLRIQHMWDDLAANRSFVDSASILGATQVAGGNPKASTDPKNRHIDMDSMGPAKYWPDYLGCFHPGVLGGADSGSHVVMQEFVKVYWSKQLSCSGAHEPLIV